LCNTLNGSPLTREEKKKGRGKGKKKERLRVPPGAFPPEGGGGGGKEGSAVGLEKKKGGKHPKEHLYKGRGKGG